MSMNDFRRFPYRRGRPGYPYYQYPYGQPYPYAQPYPYTQQPCPYGQCPYNQPNPYQQPYTQPVPSAPPTGTCPQGALPYTVQSGDTLENIASRLGISPDAITSTNPGVNFSVPLQNGQSICLPAENE
ncbi:MAG TPA: hypothetical protein DDW50_03555 [Firmicutes bacterium]|jgi:hypothetical protein|nr:hypothetical protein [Bacillota bacterium]